jgi:hypothetical protein
VPTIGGTSSETDAPDISQEVNRIAFSGSTGCRATESEGKPCCNSIELDVFNMALSILL